MPGFKLSKFIIFPNQKTKKPKFSTLFWIKRHQTNIFQEILDKNCSQISI
jgi:hypothetical protein